MRSLRLKNFVLFVFFVAKILPSQKSERSRGERPGFLVVLEKRLSAYHA